MGPLGLHDDDRAAASGPPASAAAPSDSTAEGVGTSASSGQGTGAAGTDRANDTASSAAPGRTVLAGGAADPGKALAQLDAERTAAFVAGNRDRLASVYADGRARAADVKRLTELTSAGRSVRGLTSKIEQVRVLRADSGTAVVDARTVTSAYEVKGPGRSVQKIPRAARDARFTMVRVKDVWRIESVAPWE